MKCVQVLFSAFFLFSQVRATCRTTNTIDSRAACNNDPACGWNGSTVFLSLMGAPCVFPFVYKGTTYRGCTSIDHHRPWCATTENYVPNQGLWGNCDVPSCATITEGDRDGLIQMQEKPFPCSQVPGCCKRGFDEAHDYFSPPVDYTATYFVTVKAEADLEPVMDLASNSFRFSFASYHHIYQRSRQRRRLRQAATSLSSSMPSSSSRASQDRKDEDQHAAGRREENGRRPNTRNEQNRLLDRSVFRRTFLADLVPSELAPLVHDHRVEVVDCDGVISTGDRNLHNRSGVAEEYCHSHAYRHAGCRVPAGYRFSAGGNGGVA